MIHGINDTSPASWGRPCGIIDRARVWSNNNGTGWTTGTTQNAPSKGLAFLEPGAYAVLVKGPGKGIMGYAGGKFIGTVGGADIWTADQLKSRFYPNPSSVNLLGGSLTPDPDAVAVVKVDDLGDYAAGHLFRDQSATLGQFCFMRHLGSQAINGSTRTEALAPSGHDLSQSLSIPEAVNFAARCGISDNWSHLPHLITDKDALAAFQWIDKNTPGQPLELSNEIWNWQFPQARYAVAQDGLKGDVWHGTRLAQLTLLAKGLNVRFVLASQFENPQRFVNTYAAFQKAGGDDSKLAAIAPAIYNDALQNAATLDLAKRGDMAGAYQALAAYQPKLDGWLAAIKALADKWGKELWVYEAHPLSLYPGGITGIAAADKQTVLDFQTALMRDARIVPVWKALSDGAEKGGVKRIGWFNYAHQPSVGGGYWGLIDTPIWPELVRAAAGVVAPASAPGKPAVDTAPILAQLDAVRAAVAAMG